VSHPDGAWRCRGRRLTLDGGLVLVAVLVHRRDLRARGEGRETRPSDVSIATVSGHDTARVCVCVCVCVYLSPVFPQITGLLGREKTKQMIFIVNIQQGHHTCPS